MRGPDGTQLQMRANTHGTDRNKSFCGDVYLSLHTVNSPTIIHGRHLRFIEKLIELEHFYILKCGWYNMWSSVRMARTGKIEGGSEI